MQWTLILTKIELDGILRTVTKNTNENVFSLKEMCLNHNLVILNPGKEILNDLMRKRNQ